MIYRALFRPRLHCTLMISVFGKVGPTSNNSNTSVRNLSPKSSIGQSGFKISASKTVAVLFTIKAKPQPIKSVFQSTTIPLRKEYKYLGVTFQSNGLYHSHIQHVFNKCQKRLKILRLHKGTSWGTAKDPLLTIYRSLIRSVIEYGMEAYFFSSQSSIIPLFKVQSNALRLCTGAMPSTPIVCLQHACHEMPLHIKHRLFCLQYKVHLLTFRKHPGLSLVTDCWQEIFRDSRNFCSFNMFTKHSGDLLSHLGVAGSELTSLILATAQARRVCFAPHHTSYRLPPHCTSYQIIHT